MTDPLAELRQLAADVRAGVVPDRLAALEVAADLIEKLDASGTVLLHNAPTPPDPKVEIAVPTAITLDDVETS